MSEKKFATAINCMDGRVQLPVIKYLIEKYSVDYVDIITEPGPNKIICECNDAEIIDSIKKRVELSVDKHGSKIVAISGHHDCAGNPQKKGIQLKQLNSAIKVVKSWNLNVQIIGLWINDNWKVNEVPPLEG